MATNPEKVFHSTVRRVAVSGGPLSGMASSVVEFYPAPAADQEVELPSVRSPSNSVPEPGPQTIQQIIESIHGSLCSVDGMRPSGSLGVLCLRLCQVKGIKPAIIELLSYDTLPAFRTLLVEAPETISVSADFLRTLRNVCSDGQPIAWTTTCRNSPDGYLLHSWHTTARALASFTRHGFLHTVKFLSAGTDSEFDSIVSCVAALNAGAARSDIGPMSQISVYVAPDTPYDSYAVTSVQSRCLRYGYSFAPM